MFTNTYQSGIYKEIIIRKRQTTQQKIGQGQEQAVDRKGNPNGLQTNEKMLDPNHVQENANENTKEINALQWQQLESLTTNINQDVEAWELLYTAYRNKT